MGSGSSKSRPNSGQQESYDEDEYKAIKNWEGDVIGWVRHCANRFKLRYLVEWNSAMIGLS